MASMTNRQAYTRTGRVSRVCWIAPLAALVVALGAGCGEKNPAIRVSGRVELDAVRVGSKLGGRVAKVWVREGDAVEAGQVLVALERDELEAELRQARAALREVDARLALVKAGARAEDVARAKAALAEREAALRLSEEGARREVVQAAEAEVQAARTARELARKERDRARQLQARGVIQEGALDAKKAAFDTAVAALEGAEQRWKALRDGSRPLEVTMAKARVANARAALQRLQNGARPEELRAQAAAVEAARARLQQIETRARETEVRAPKAALVETLDLEPGDILRPGQVAAILTLPAEPWVRCYVPEGRLAEVSVGQVVSVELDGRAGPPLEGRVRRIARRAQFTPRNVQTQDKRAELVFEVEVALQGPAPIWLHAGVYADVTLRAPAPAPGGGAPR